jgi:hypothetical protein
MATCNAGCTGVTVYAWHGSDLLATTQDQPDEAVNAFKLQAFEVLIDDKKRRAYNAELKRKQFHREEVPPGASSSARNAAPREEEEQR